MKPGIRALFVTFFILVFFLVAALAYFSPVLQGKAIYQSDIVQYTGMAKEQSDFREKTGSEPYWTNSAFGGMPTYQLGAQYPHDYIKKLDRLLRFLPRPADYLFLYFLGFYILLCCLKVDYRLAALGAIAFGFSTYLIIILGVGHNAKAHAIAYLPMLLGGILLTLRGKWVWGFALTAIAMALEVAANHYQMTYYFMLLVLVLGAFYLVQAIRSGTLKQFATSVGVLFLAVILGIGVNATSLLATKEYADWSSRGRSELTIEPDGSPRTNRDGLDREYITQYSFGLFESLTIFVPRLFGGSNSEDLGEESKAYSFLTEQGLPRARALEFSSALPLYWGDQPILAGPAYVGAIVCFLFILGLFLVKGPHKWWLTAGVLLSLILSWGKNFSLLTDFMIDYFPLYDKFRAVSSIQILLELCMPVLAVLALREYLKPEVVASRKTWALKWSLIVVGCLGIIIFLAKGFFDFTALNDATYQQYFGEEVMAMIRRDREAVYINDTLRSLMYVALAALALWLFLKRRMGQNLLLLSLAVLILFDLVGVDRRYVNNSDFVRQKEMTEPFRPTDVDRQLQEESGQFRVFNPSEGLNGSRTSYFHQSIGGYHAAKPAGMQDLFDFHIYKNNVEVLSMLNVRYVIQENEEGQPYAATNPDANGNAWFVENLRAVPDADAEILALDSLDTRNEAVFNASRFPDLKPATFARDSAAAITLEEYKPNRLTYHSSNSSEGLAVFSEMYYPQGWQAYLDGNKVSHFRVNYVLRALKIPAGEHKVEFRFEPEVVETGSRISLASSIVLALLILTGAFFRLRGARSKEETR